MRTTNFASSRTTVSRNLRPYIVLIGVQQQPWPAIVNGRYSVPSSPTYLPAALHTHFVNDKWGVYPRHPIYRPHTRYNAHAIRHYGDFLNGSAFMLPMEFHELGDSERISGLCDYEWENQLARGGWSTSYSTKPQGWLRHNRFTKETAWARDRKGAVQWQVQSPHERQGGCVY